MRPIWAGTKNDRRHVRHYSGVLYDDVNYELHKFYYTPKSPAFVRVNFLTFTGYMADHPFSVRDFTDKGYRQISEETFKSQCPLFESSLGQLLLIRKLKNGF